MTALPPSAIAPRHSPIHGSGVYACQPIFAGTVITEYTGEVITTSEASLREKSRQYRASQGEESCDYLYILNENFAIDGRDSSNVARLINHACEANCGSDIIEDRVWIIARRDILSGEEITFDYGYTFRDGINHPCCCGSAYCVGYIIDKSQRWRLRRWREKQRAEGFNPLTSLL